jgi:ferredoxin
MPTSPPPAPCQVRLDASGLTFLCTPGEPLLDAAYASGVALPYACRRGICGLCAARLLEGEVRPVDNLPMTNARCGPHEVLLCRCTPVTTQLRLQPSQAQAMPQAKPLPSLGFR